MTAAFALEPTEEVIEPDDLDAIDVPLGDPRWAEWSKPVLEILSIPRCPQWLHEWALAHNMNWELVRSCLAWLSVNEMIDCRIRGGAPVWCLKLEQVVVRNDNSQQPLKETLVNLCNAYELNDAETFVKIVETARVVTGLATGPFAKALNAPTVSIYRWTTQRIVPWPQIQRRTVDSILRYLDRIT